MRGWEHFASELKSHLPFTVFATGAGILLAGILTFVAAVQPGPHEAPQAPPAKAMPASDHDHDGHKHEDAGRDAHAGHAHGSLAIDNPHLGTAASMVFHVFHPLHMLLSAIATTAMFWRHDRNLIKAVITGVIGSAGICGLSDVGLPYLSGVLLGVDMHFHWCLIAHPMTVIPFMLVGVFTGLLAPSAVEHATHISHSGHVFVSSVASIFYLVSFGLAGWVGQVGYVFVVVVVAVVVPCCLSDIAFPLLVANREGLVCCPDRNHLHRITHDHDAHDHDAHDGPADDAGRRAH